jgi:hypothetical protein
MPQAGIIFLYEDVEKNAVSKKPLPSRKGGFL